MSLKPMLQTISFATLLVTMFPVAIGRPGNEVVVWRAMQKVLTAFAPLAQAWSGADVVGDPQKLNITTRRNGHIVQSSNTADMIFGVYRLLSFLSQATTLSAGTIVMTGTPPGVAAFREPQVFLKKGEIVECEIERIGCLKNEII